MKNRSWIATGLLLFLAAVALGQRDTDQAKTLKPNQRLERTLKGGETHSYKIKLKANEFFHVEVRQLGIDVELSLIDSDRKTIVIRDRPNGAQGQESLSFIATRSGRYWLEVKSLDDKVVAATYLLESYGHLTPTEQDKIGIEAETLFQRGLDLSAENSIDSAAQACAKYERAIALWRVIGDKYAEALTQTSLALSQENSKETEKALVSHGRALLLYRALDDKRFVAISLTHLSVLNVLLQQPEVARAQYREAKSIFSSLQDVDGEKELKNHFTNLAAVYLANGINHSLEESVAARRTALMSFALARDLFQEVGDKGNEAVVLSASARLHLDLEEPQKAFEKLNDALSLYRQLNDKRGEATALNNIARLYSDRGDKKTALAYYENMVLPLYREHNDTEGQLRTLKNIASVYLDLYERQRAIDTYNQTLPLHVELKDRKGQATTLNNIGRLYAVSNKKREALDYFENRALPLFRDFHDQVGEATTLNNIAGVYADLGEHQKALSLFHQALSLRVEARDRKGEATTLNNIGFLYSDMGDKERALDYYKNKALPIFQAIKDKSGEATTRNNIGMVYFALGEQEKALNSYQQALSLNEEANDRAGVATVLNNIGGLFSDTGDLQKALDYYENKALPIFRDLKDVSREAAALNNIGTVYSELGDQQKALNKYNEALPLFEQAKNKRGEATALNNIGRVYSDLGNTQKALDYYKNKALPIYREIENKEGEATTLNNIGRMHFDSNEHQKALSFYNQALHLWAMLENSSGEASTLSNIGSTYSELGQQQKAFDYFTRALSTFRAIRDKSSEATCLNNLMLVSDRVRNPRAAILFGKQSVNAYQTLRLNTQQLDNETQRSFVKSVDYTYRYLAALLIEQGRLAEALQVLNSFKDQQYFDFNGETSKRPSPLAFTKREVDLDSRYEIAADRVSNSLSQVNELRRRIGKRPPSVEESAILQQLESESRSAMDSFIAVLKQGQTEFRQPPDLRKDKEPRLDEVEKLQGALRRMAQEKKLVAVYTLVGEKTFRALVVTSRDIRAVSSPIAGKELNNKAKQLWALLQGGEYDPRQLSKEIYDAVFKPIKAKLTPDKTLERDLPEGTTVMWSLDGNLRYLPMSALYDGKKYMVERYNNVVFTRMESNPPNSIPSDGWTGVGFGSSSGGTVEYLQTAYLFDDLPHATKELNAVFSGNNSAGGVFKGDVFNDANFTRPAMLASLSEHRPLVHIASHFRFSPGDQARSFLLLGDKSIFPLSEIKQHRDLFAGVELLTLSACETAAHWGNSNGREVDGFAELAQRLGAKAVLASVWNVSDESTYWLMTNFYQRKQSVPSQTKAESLRKAQIALLVGTAKVPLLTRPSSSARGKLNSVTVKVLRQGEAYRSSSEEDIVYIEAKYAQPYQHLDSRPYAHPYFWSPFVLFGNWR